MADLYQELVTILRRNGCYLVRKGKGSHEIWHNPATNKNITVPRKSRHTANEVLKQAGLPKAF